MPAALMLHCGSKGITEKDLGKLKTPKPLGRWFPVSHLDMLKMFQAELETRHLEISSQRLAVSRDGKLFFGVLTVEGKDSGDKDVSLSLGLRNSTNKALAAGLVMGSHVTVCDNMAFSGEISLARKHTISILRDMPGMISRAMDHYPAFVRRQQDIYGAWKDAEIDDPKAHDIMVRTIKDGILPVTHLPRLVKCWTAPAQADFEPRTAWSLFNAYTEVEKESLVRNPIDGSRRLSNLSDLFTREFSPGMHQIDGLVIPRLVKVVKNEAGFEDGGAVEEKAPEGLIEGRARVKAKAKAKAKEPEVATIKTKAKAKVHPWRKDKAKVAKAKAKKVKGKAKKNTARSAS